MNLLIKLLGRPVIERGSDEVYRFRSQKTWGLLAVLILREHPPTRSWLSSLMFDAADDPLRALRWSLTEIRRALHQEGSVDGDPVVLDLSENVLVDVDALLHGPWTDAATLPGLGEDLLSGINVRRSPAFESWLLSQRHHIAAVSEAVLHEAAVASMARGDMGRAIELATRTVNMNPFDENNQALLIGLYARAGDRDAATRQLRACTQLFESELGVSPGATVVAAQYQTRPQSEGSTDETSTSAALESGSAAISAGAVEAGVQSLRSAVARSDSGGHERLRITSRLALAGALIHSMRGQDEEGSAFLHEAAGIAGEMNEQTLQAQAHAELGYVDFLRGRYDRAEVWLRQALASIEAGDPIHTRATAYMGSVASDRADYPTALDLLQTGADGARASSDSRLEAYALSMLGRAHLLRGELDAAAGYLDTAISVCEQYRYLDLLPWPQALRGELEIAKGNTAAAEATLDQAFARACQLGDPCWEGISARGLALTAAAVGDISRSFEILDDAHRRCNRLADPYVWLEAHILDAKCTLGIEHGHSDAGGWVDALHGLASRTGMKEFIVRSLLHRSALGDSAAPTTARLLGGEIDNPTLRDLIASLPA